MSDPIAIDRAAIDRAAIDPNRVQSAFIEDELAADGSMQPVLTLLTTGRECVFDCVFCDLWRHTLPHATPVGAIPRQLEAALAELTTLPPTIKLYNASNWFDARAVPPVDWPAIADLLQPFDRVVVENHPKLCTDAVPRFRDRLGGRLEVAIGVESIDPRVLPRLNKSVTADQIAAAFDRLHGWDIDTRAFVLIPPPLLPDSEVVESVAETVRWTVGRGVGVVSLLPLRPTQMPDARRPRIEEVAAVLARCPVALPQRLLVDTWDADQWTDAAGRGSLQHWNRHQLPPP